MPVSDFAAIFLARHRHFADFVDEDETNAQSELLRANGLDVLNTKILAAPSGEVLDVIAEHNTAAMLVRREFTDLQHEPPSMSRPVDLVGMYIGRRYRVEVKRLAASEHDELHSTVMRTLNTALASNTKGIIIEMRLRESFEAAAINALIRHVKEALRQPRMEQAYAFAPDGEVLASYTFRLGVNATQPRVGILGDMGMVREVTGDDERRVRSKVKRAYDKFKTCPDDGAVHLLALEADNTIQLAHVADGLYGREYATFTRQGYAGSGRHPGGVFSRGLHSRLGGVVVVRRVERHRLFCAYSFTLFGNPSGALPVPDVVQALGEERVRGPKDFPT